jgi:hypothetical protein
MDLPGFEVPAEDLCAILAKINKQTPERVRGHENLRISGGSPSMRRTTESEITTEKDVFPVPDRVRDVPGS